MSVMHRMKMLLFFIMVLTYGKTVSACEAPFSPKNVSVNDQVERAFKANDVIAIVYVSDVSKGKEYPESNVTFEVLDSFKGSTGTFSTGMVAECCLCQMQFEKGKAYVIYATAPTTGRNYWYISNYGLSKELSELSGAELTYLRKYAQ